MHDIITNLLRTEISILRDKHNGATFLAGLGRCFCGDACFLFKHGGGAKKNGMLAFFFNCWSGKYYQHIQNFQRTRKTNSSSSSGPFCSLLSASQLNFCGPLRKASRMNHACLQTKHSVGATKFQMLAFQGGRSRKVPMLISEKIL